MKMLWFKSELVNLVKGVLKRKLMVGVMAYAAALALVQYVNDYVSLLVFILLITAVFLSLRKIKKKYISDACIFALVFFVLGSLVMGTAEGRAELFNTGDKIKIEGQITNIEEFEYSDRYTVKLGSAYLSCFIYAEKDLDYSVGDKIKAIGLVEEFDSPRNDGGFDSKSYYKASNIRFSINADNIELINRPKFNLAKSLRSFRQLLAFKIDKYMDKNSGLLKAIVLGCKDDIDEVHKQLYQRAGISHILAISGLHVSIFSMLIFYLLNFFRIPKKLSCFFTIMVLIIYAVFSGFSSSVVRAVCMFSVSKAAFYKGKNYDIPTALALSYFIYTLIYPYAFNSAGTLLSYSAVIAIWIFSVKYKKVHILKSQKKLVNFFDNKIIKTILMGLFLSCFSLPLVLYLFYTLPVYSVIINLYVIPMMTVLFILAIFAMLFSFINGMISGVLFDLCDLIIESYTCISDISVNELKGSLVIGKPESIEVIFYYLLLFIILVAFNGIKKKYLLMAVMIIPIILLVAKPNTNSITMVDVDQGDCTIVATKDDMHFMIDCGSLGKTEIFKYTVEPYLLSNGIGKIDYCFLSHADSDHINGIVEYLKSEVKLIKIKNIVITYQMYIDEDIIENIVKPAKENNVSIKLMNAGDMINSKYVEINCIHPAKDYVANDVNDSSMVLELGFKNFNALFTGDISSTIEEQLDINSVELLKVAHHGSDTGTAPVFLDRIKAKIALISCGIDNSYGHPSDRVISDLNKYNVNTYVSAEKGQTKIILKRNSKLIKSYFH